ncbi:MAG TPA: hypothetical protein VI485_04875 [Vicinamibacterales bacterium]|nr:hypothetical protein [Vicinamibacterales bacterium]
MTDPATKSFEIRTAHQYLDGLLRPAHGDFLKDALSPRKAITCAIFAWHLRDWIWAQYKREFQVTLHLKELADFDRYLFANCPELELIQEIANWLEASSRGGFRGQHDWTGSWFCQFAPSIH